jgi:hypothetical protein
MKAIVTVLLCFALTTHDAAAQLYGAVGWARVDSDRPDFGRTDLINLGEAPTGGTNGADTIPLAVGYAFSKPFALELSYLDAHELHSVSYTVSAATDPLSLGTYTRKWSFRSIGLAGVGSLHLGSSSFALVGKLAFNFVTGEYRSTAHATRANVVPPQVLINESSSVKNSDWIPSAALGIAYTGKPIGARLLYERFGSVGGLYGPGNELSAVRAISLQAVMSF